MSEKDRIWRKGDPKWTYTEGEIVPRYMWSQVNLFEITELLNAAEKANGKYKAIATLERQLKKNIARADKLKEQLAAQTARADAAGEWKMPPLNEWSIVGMNHYHVNGEKFLFVSLQKEGRCITEEGKDDKYLWDRLWHKAKGKQLLEEWEEIEDPNSGGMAALSVEAQKPCGRKRSD